MVIIITFTSHREVSHPNLIELEKIPSETHPECSNVAMVRALSTKSSKSLIWISAKDKSKEYFSLYLKILVKYSGAR